jgi:hypothetical protein
MNESDVDLSENAPDAINPIRANKTYRFYYNSLDGSGNILVDEQEGYLVVTGEFCAVCRDQGEVLMLSPMAQIRSVRQVEPVAGRA